MSFNISGSALVKVLFGTKFLPAKLNNPFLTLSSEWFLSFITIHPILDAGIMNLFVIPEHALKKFDN